MGHPIIAQNGLGEDVWKHTLDTYGDIEIRTDQVKWVISVDGQGHLRIRAVNRPLGRTQRIVIVPEVTNHLVLESRDLFLESRDL